MYQCLDASIHVTDGLLTFSFDVSFDCFDVSFDVSFNVSFDVSFDVSSDFPWIYLFSQKNAKKSTFSRPRSTEFSHLATLMLMGAFVTL